MKLDVVLEKTGLAALSKSQVKEAVKTQLFAAGEYWHKHFRKRHFQAGAFQRYRYTPRTERYQWRKMKKGLGNNPLVFTGVSRTLSEGKTVKATSEKVDVVMPTRAFNWKNPHSQINMLDEFTQISADEHNEIDQLMESGLRRYLTNPTVTKTTRLRDSSGRFIKG